MWTMWITGLKGQPLRLFTLTRGAKGRGAAPCGTALTHCLAALSVNGDLPFASLAASRVLPSSSPV
ncbi:hypothetical protein J7S99_18790 [Providencia rettgeri]|uniref:hypothetical protein n=1 Tax=Providencia rettgeri TaxID=587 RepID=UPI001B388CCB|nr:hypothetical protein [Providencia rettgeri]MBQ0399629.1 hypothetical protein [Providencia rettgeri]